MASPAQITFDLGSNIITLCDYAELEHIWVKDCQGLLVQIASALQHLDILAGQAELDGYISKWMESLQGLSPMAPAPAQFKEAPPFGHCRNRRDFTRNRKFLSFC